MTHKLISILKVCTRGTSAMPETLTQAGKILRKCFGHRATKCLPNVSGNVLVSVWWRYCPITPSASRCLPIWVYCFPALPGVTHHSRMLVKRYPVLSGHGVRVSRRDARLHTTRRPAFFNNTFAPGRGKIYLRMIWWSRPGAKLRTLCSILRRHRKWQDFYQF